MSEDVKPYGAQAARPDEPTPDELRALIARTGLSQRRAAEAIDVSERMMRYYASGQEKIPRSVLYALRYLAGRQEHQALNALLCDVHDFWAGGDCPPELWERLHAAATGQMVASGGVLPPG